VDCVHLERRWTLPGRHSRSDLLPLIRPDLSMILEPVGKVKGNVSEQAHGSGDDRGAEADGSEAQGGGGGAEGGVSKPTLYDWKAKQGGMEVSQAQEVKKLREENTRRRELVADLSLDKEALPSVIRKSGWSS